VAIFVMRTSRCTQVTYDGGAICLGGGGREYWFAAGYAFWLALVCWLLCTLVIPVLVARKTGSPGWGLVAFFLVLSASIAGEQGGYYWIERVYPERSWQDYRNGPPVALISIFSALFVTLIGSVVAVEFSRN
jgi:hypothetical protein